MNHQYPFPWVGCGGRRLVSLGPAHRVHSTGIASDKHVVAVAAQREVFVSSLVHVPWVLVSLRTLGSLMAKPLYTYTDERC
jgi:hypothetical protein